MLVRISEMGNMLRVRIRAIRSFRSDAMIKSIEDLRLGNGKRNLQLLLYLWRSSTWTDILVKASEHVDLSHLPMNFWT